MPITKEAAKGVRNGILMTVLLGVGILIGSRNLAHFDAALVGYTFASLFATFGITYRYSLWLERPPTKRYWQRGWELFLKPKFWGKHTLLLIKKFFTSFILTTFIWRRGFYRGLAHWPIMWGCILAAMITFPLVFGWLYFESGGPSGFYRIVVFGFPTMSFNVESLEGKLIFHGLVIAAVLVIAGVMIAMRRRMRDSDAATLQNLGDDILPLVMLFAISITGLMLTVSYTWLRGYGYSFLAVFHAITVIFTLIWLPFGKFFHIFQRPAQLGVALYKEVGKKSAQAKCLRCQEEFASQMHIDDLIWVQDQLGYKYHLSDKKLDHYQRICPRCRRKLLAISHRIVCDKQIPGSQLKDMLELEA